GAEIVTTIRPAQTAARHRAEAQVRAFDVRRPDEDFAEGLGQGQVGQFLGRDLDRDVGLRIPLGVDLIEVGALDPVDQGRDPISVRKSSRRSDQRRPPRATGPKRRCVPSTYGAQTKISRKGLGRGRSASSWAAILIEMWAFGFPSAST